MFIARVYSEVHERKGMRKDGSSFTFKYQEAELLRDGHRPRIVRISAPPQGRYEEGLYTLTAESFRPDRYEKLEMSFPELVPLDVAMRVADKLQKAWRNDK